MGGINPYIQQVETGLPRNKYTITFVLGGAEKVVEVDPAQLPYSDEGLPGSILDVACGQGIPIDHACGGVCACSTCHVIVEQGGDTCSEASDAELDMLDNAPGLTEQSRLSCQTVPDGTAPVRVVVPGWNRNLVREEHH